MAKSGMEMLFGTLIKSLNLDPELIKKQVAGGVQIVAGVNSRLGRIERLLTLLAREQGITLPDEKPPTEIAGELSDSSAKRPN